MSYDPTKSMGERFQDAFLEAWGDERLVPFSALPAPAQAKWDRAAVSFVSRLSDAPVADGWRDMSSAPEDGTFVLGCQSPDDGLSWHKTWEQWKAPTTIAFRAFHPNAPGKTQWRDAKGAPVHVTHWRPLLAPPADHRPSVARSAAGNLPPDTPNPFLPSSGAR